MRITADRGVCIGAGLCVSTSDTGFDQDDDGIVVVLVDEPDDIDLAREAVSLCPSRALGVVE